MLKSKDFMHNSGNGACGIISFYDLTENAQLAGWMLSISHRRKIQNDTRRNKCGKKLEQ